MNRFAESIRLAIKTENWYGALCVALIVPELCGSIEDPKNSSKRRYVNWYNRHMRERYTQTLPKTGRTEVLMSGDDCYALRCALLHQGSEDVRNHRSRDVLERFYFVAPKKGWTFHSYKLGTVLQLQVDTFCLNMCEGLKDWLLTVQENKDIQAEFERLIYVRDPASDGILITQPRSVDKL